MLKFLTTFFSLFSVSNNLNENKQNFELGVSTSAFQIESSYNRSQTIWDDFIKKKKLSDINNGPLHDLKYEEDFKIMKDLGIKEYRFSFSWARFLEEEGNNGIQLYSDIIRTMKNYEIEPCVTLFHWDVPSKFQNDETIKGFETQNIIPHFLEYADKVFENFHNDVKCWITINEPYTFVKIGYEYGHHAPGKYSKQLSLKVKQNLLKTHIETYKLFHKKYNDGVVSISLNSDWVDCSNNEIKEKELDEMIGSYVSVVIDHMDYFALNHYTTKFFDKNGNLITYNLKFPIHSASSWLYYYPRGFRNLLNWLEETFELNRKNLSVRITESGWSSYNEIHDSDRIMYLRNYIEEAKLSNVNITHYYVWSFLDNFEWDKGFNERFGLIYIDFNSKDKSRKLKDSIKWLFSN